MNEWGWWLTSTRTLATLQGGPGDKDRWKMEDGRWKEVPVQSEVGIQLLADLAAALRNMSSRI
jgi:hypothetical protein